MNDQISSALLSGDPARILADPRTAILFFLFILWPIPWKAFALWRSARHGQFGWFLALIIINTAGILEILYISFFQHRHDEEDAIVPDDDNP